MNRLFLIIALVLALDRAWAGSTAVLPPADCPQSVAGDRIPDTSLDHVRLARELTAAGYAPVNGTGDFTILFSGGEGLIIAVKREGALKALKYPMMSKRPGSARHELAMLERVNRKEKEINAGEAQPVYYFPEGRLVVVGSTECVEYDFISRSDREPQKRARTLGQLMIYNQFDGAARARVIRELMRAVHRIRLAGVVHRDLKLENILIIEGEREISDQQGGTQKVWAVQAVKVVDFGLAALPGEYPEGLADYSTGTLEAMSPQQLLTGAAAYIDDRWGIGRLFMDLVHGKRRAYGEAGATPEPHMFERPANRTTPWFDYRHAPEDELENKALAVAIASTYPEDIDGYFDLIRKAWRVKPEEHDAFFREYAELLRKAPVTAVKEPTGRNTILVTNPGYRYGRAIYEDSTAAFNILRSKNLIARFFADLGYDDRRRDEVIRAFYLHRLDIFPNGRSQPPRAVKQADLFHPFLYWDEFESRLAQLRTDGKIPPEIDYLKEMHRN